MKPTQKPSDLPHPGTIALVGVPFDDYSSYLRGCAAGPSHVRRVLNSGASNWCTEKNFDLIGEKCYQDLGDLHLGHADRAFERIDDAFAQMLAADARIIAIGGDHAITYPIIKAYARYYSSMTILHFDAHPDLYDEYEGNRNSHACPFARIMEEQLAAHLTQVGIRTMNLHQRQQADRFGVQVVEMQAWSGGMANLPDLNLKGPVYISLDMDVLDPAFAPGVSHHEPGGLSTRALIQLIQDLQMPIVGADLVEFNPRRDPVGITAQAAAKLLKELAACMLASNS